MDNEVFRDLTHDEAARDVAATAQRDGHLAIREHRLPNGYVADVLVVTTAGNIEIIEVKTTWKASLAEIAYEKYWSFCHRLYIAVPGLESIPLEGWAWPPRWGERRDKLGLIGVHRTGLRFLRPAELHNIHGLHQAKMLQSLPVNSRSVG